MKGRFNLKSKFQDIAKSEIFISEITLAELLFGVENSEAKIKNKLVLDNFLTGIQILPIYHSLELFAKEKSRLRKMGNPIDDFDLLIGVTSISHDLIMVTNNIKHFNKLEGIQIEDWTLV